jgi:alpha-ribazole phosphatase/probable phosphoglycerate mutase
MARMSTIVFIRHGETDMAGRFCGHSDPDLNATGKREAIRVAEEISMLNIARIYSSDLRRAAQTAQAIAERVGINVDYSTGLREICFGQWEGLSWQEIESQFLDEAGKWLREFPLQSALGGESYSAFTARVEAIIEELIQEPEVSTIAVIAHRGVMRYALTRFFGFTEAEAWTRTAAYGATVVVTRTRVTCEVLP